MIKKEIINTLAEQHLSGTDKFITDIKVLPGNRIQVFIDADSSVFIADCAQMNRFIESQLDRDKEDFELEVSSAGLDCPLRLPRQFVKNKGREVKIITKEGMLKKGVLTEITEHNITINEKTIQKINKKKEIINRLFTVAFDEIKEVRLIVNI